MVVLVAPDGYKYVFFVSDPSPEEITVARQHFGIAACWVCVVSLPEFGLTVRGSRRPDDWKLALARRAAGPANWRQLERVQDDPAIRSLRSL
jgi:hypothetical protein